MQDFPVKTQLEVRWRDTDAIGHVNNAVYFSYFEMGRLRYHELVYGGLEKSSMNFILASAACDFLLPLHVGDRVEVGIRVEAVGKTSFDYGYEVRRVADGALAARGRSTQVFFDYAKNEKCPPPEGWLARVEEIQGAPVTRR